LFIFSLKFEAVAEISRLAHSALFSNEAYVFLLLSLLLLLESELIVVRRVSPDDFGPFKFEPGAEISVRLLYNEVL